MGAGDLMRGIGAGGQVKGIEAGGWNWGQGTGFVDMAKERKDCATPYG